LYQYNGKELVEDNGLSWHSYGKRYYDAVIGRFPNVDPLIDTFHFVTGYNYAENEPVANIDLWGLQKKQLITAESLINRGQEAATLGDYLGKSEVATTSVGLLTGQPEVAAAGNAVGLAGGVMESTGKLMELTGKVMNGTAIPKDVVDTGISIYLEFTVPEVVEQAAKATGIKDEVVKVVTAAVSTVVNEAMQYLTTPPAATQIPQQNSGQKSQ
jgi:RHS repeat-associated protein